MGKVTGDTLGDVPQIVRQLQVVWPEQESVSIRASDLVVRAFRVFPDEELPRHTLIRVPRSRSPLEKPA